VGCTPLHFSAQGQQPVVARLLLEAGAPVDAQDKFGKTPLWVALFNVKGGAGEVVRVLLAAGASPDIQNESGISPRAQATSVANYDLMRFFE
jgi:ankyrin repeat protein